MLTVSPVPLNATFEMESAVVADCVSKATLRVAVEDVLRQGIPGVRYFPSFEIVRWLSAYLPGMYGEDDGSTVHISERVVDASCAPSSTLTGKASPEQAVRNIGICCPYPSDAGGVDKRKTMTLLQNGYVAFPGYLDGQDIDAIAAEFERLVHDEKAVAPLPSANGKHLIAHPRKLSRERYPALFSILGDARVQKEIGDYFDALYGPGWDGDAWPGFHEQLQVEMNARAGYGSNSMWYFASLLGQVRDLYRRSRRRQRCHGRHPGQPSRCAARSPASVCNRSGAADARERLR